MKVFIGADHRGFQLKAQIVELVRGLGYEIEDLGAYTADQPCDYPEISYQVATRTAQTPEARGILVCMTGIGHTIAANKIPGAYAALCYNREAAALSREHNNANVLVLGAKFVAAEEMKEIVVVWLKTAFAGGRHERRVRQIQEIEKKFLNPHPSPLPGGEGEGRKIEMPHPNPLPGGEGKGSSHGKGHLGK